MELWIRSQDKTRLGKIELIEYQEDDYGFYLFGWKDKFEGTRLATYKTKERALEVLDKIQRLITPTIEYNPVVKKEESWEEEYQRTVLKGYDVKIEQAVTYVYEMPKE